jgi:hypothetical protein
MSDYICIFKRHCSMAINSSMNSIGKIELETIELKLCNNEKESAYN